MNAIKRFNENFVMIQETAEGILFRASDIETILGLKDINVTISDFDFDETDYTTISSVNYLSEVGLYYILFIYKNKTITEDFSKWTTLLIRVENRSSFVYKYS